MLACYRTVNKISTASYLSIILKIEAFLWKRDQCRWVGNPLTSYCCLCSAYDLCLQITEISMYRSAARTKTLCQLLRRERGRSGSLSCRNVGSSAAPSTLTVSTLRAPPSRQPFASVLISKFCSSNSEKFTDERTQRAAYNFEETVSKLEPYHTSMRNSVTVGNVQKIDSTIVEMRLNGLSPTEETYDYLVAAHIVNKDFKAARQTIDDLKDLGISHTTKIMITLMKAYSKVGDFDGTKKVYDEVIHSGFPPGTFEMQQSFLKKFLLLPVSQSRLH